MSEIDARIAAAIEERDTALTQLAQARAELDALKLALQRRGEEAPPVYPAGTNPAAVPPRRYVLADRVWRVAKRGLEFFRR